MFFMSYIQVVVLTAIVFSMSRGHYEQGKGHKQWCSEDIGGACTPHDECADCDVIDARCRGREVCCKIPDPCKNAAEVCNVAASADCQTNLDCTGNGGSVITEIDPGAECCDGLVCCEPASCKNAAEVCNVVASADCQTDFDCSTSEGSVITEDPGAQCCDGLVCCEPRTCLLIYFPCNDAEGGTCLPCAQASGTIVSEDPGSTCCDGLECCV